MSDLTSKTSIPLADPWILGSLMQKAIRRGDCEFAAVAWKALSTIDARRAWRRLMLIAFEDVGVADIDAVTEVVPLCLSKGPNEVLGREFVQRLALARKDRSTDYLFCDCIRHPSLRHQRFLAEQARPEENLNRLSADYDLQSRALAAIVLLQQSKGRRGFGWTRAGTVKAIVERFTQDIVARTIIEGAYKKSGEPFLLMLPLLAECVRSQIRSRSKVVDVPRTKYVGDVPMYALDKHTRVGRAAIREFLADNDNIHRCLKAHVSTENMKSAAYMAAYYTDATPVSNRFVWSDSDRLEIRGREADMHSAGVPLDGIASILDVFRQNLVHLDEIRAHYFCKKFGGGGR